MRSLNQQQFCGWCGSKVKYTSEWSSKCPECGYAKYLNPKPCTNIIVCKGDKVLFMKRAQDPKKGKYDFPGGFVDMGDDSVEDGAYRELKEELGLSKSDLTPLEYVGSLQAPVYKWHDTAIRNISMFFKTQVMDGKESNIYLDKKENSEFLWLDPSDYKNIDCAWDVDVKMLIKVFGLEV